MKPIAFIDIDGVLNRLVSQKVAKREKFVRHHGWSSGLRWALWLSRSDKDRIETLSEHFECAWGTSWEVDAYPEVGKFLGFPEFDIIARTNPNESHKAFGVARAAEGRPFVWFDDDPYYSNLSLYVDQEYKVITIDQTTGLTDDHVNEAIDWAESL